MACAGIRPTGDEMACAGIVRDGHMDATSVRANKTANLFAGIRPTGVHLWYKKNNNRNNDKFT
jgi:hypothetical protein